MKRDTLASRSVLDALRGFSAVEVDLGKDENQWWTYRPLGGIPASVLVGVDGDILWSHVGYLDSEELTEVLRSALASPASLPKNLSSAYSTIVKFHVWRRDIERAGRALSDWAGFLETHEGDRKAAGDLFVHTLEAMERRGLHDLCRTWTQYYLKRFPEGVWRDRVSLLHARCHFELTKEILPLLARRRDTLIASMTAPPRKRGLLSGLFGAGSSEATADWEKRVLPALAELVQLGDIGTNELCDALTRADHHEQASLYISALIQIRSPTVRARMRALARDRDHPVSVRVRAAEVLLCGAEQEARLLSRILVNQKEPIELRRTCATSIEAIGTRVVLRDRAVLDALASSSSERDRLLRWNCLMALYSIPGPLDLGTLASLLEDDRKGDAPRENISIAELALFLLQQRTGKVFCLDDGRPVDRVDATVVRFVRAWTADFSKNAEWSEEDERFVATE